jgi:hypothetical protein
MEHDVDLEVDNWMMMMMMESDEEEEVEVC